MEELKAELRDMIATYHELNPEGASELFEEPSPLEFMHHVARNRPFVVRGGARDWPAVRKWDFEYLRKQMDGLNVKVAMTPSGNADSVIDLADGSTMFVKPHEQDMSFSDVSTYIAKQEKEDAKGLVCYCQTQNDNLRDEFESLFKDVPKSVPFARVALQKEPDAINFWLGNSRSVTALHKDPYENIYVQVRGEKHFVLLSPLESACVNEQVHPAGTFQPSAARGHNYFESLHLHPVLDIPESEVPFAVWDPDQPEKNTSTFSDLGKPIRVTLKQGDMLYLPALWYHKVSQSCSEEGVCCAVNYWYDMEYSGSFYPLATFAKRAETLARREPARA